MYSGCEQLSTILVIKAILTASLFTTGRIPGKAISTGLILELGICE